MEPARGKNLSVVEPWRYMHLRYFLLIWIKTLSYLFFFLVVSLLDFVVLPSRQ